jgi:hypothetical protein
MTVDQRADVFLSDDLLRSGYLSEAGLALLGGSSTRGKSLASNHGYSSARQGHQIKEETVKLLIFNHSINDASIPLLRA